MADDEKNIEETSDETPETAEEPVAAADETPESEAVEEQVTEADEQVQRHLDDGRRCRHAGGGAWHRLSAPEAGQVAQAPAALGAARPAEAEARAARKAEADHADAEARGRARPPPGAARRRRLRQGRQDDRRQGRRDQEPPALQEGRSPHRQVPRPRRDEHRHRRRHRAHRRDAPAVEDEALAARRKWWRRPSDGRLPHVSHGGVGCKPSPAPSSPPYFSSPPPLVLPLCFPPPAHICAQGGRP